MKTVTLATLVFRNNEGLANLIKTTHDTSGYNNYEWVIHDNTIENISITRGFNLLFRRAKGEYFLLLNDDMHPTRKGWLKEAMESIKEREILTPRIFTNEFGSAWEVAPMLVHRSCLADVGPFDTRFIGYGSDDIDWCIRARILGWKPREFDFGFKHPGCNRGDFSKRVEKYKKINASLLKDKWECAGGEVESA